MKIILVQREIEEAISQYVGNSFMLPKGKTFDIEMAATRGASGVTAEIEVVNTNEETSSKTQEPTAKVDAEIAEDHKDESLNDKVIVKHVAANPFAEPVEEDEKPKAKKSFFADLAG